MGRALGSRYVVGELLGSGAMGQVYRGADHDGTEYAIKLLRGELVDDREFVRRFLDERSILTALRGDNLVAVHDLVIEGETAAIVMDLVEGGNLRDHLVEAGTILPAEVARIGAGIATALHEVHLANLVHRDVKPENVLMDVSTGTRVPRLTDFGVATMTGQTKVGHSTLLAGTPQYIAPEIVDNRGVTAATDLYSLGIVLYELCCGVTPFAGASMFQVLRAHGELLPGRPAGVPDALWDVIWELLRKDPAARPQSAQHVAAVLTTLTHRLWQEQAPVAPKLEVPPPAMPMDQGNTNETVLRPNPAAIVTAGPRPRRRRLPLAVAGLVLATGLGAGGYYAFAGRATSAGPAPTTTSAEVGATGVDRTPGRSVTATTTASEVRLTSMPDLVGLKLGEARDKLPKSMKVDIVEQVDEKHPDGEVLHQEPASGQPVGENVKLVVARPAVTVFLDALRPATGDWDDDGGGYVVGMAGKQYLHSVGTGTLYECGEANSVEYNLSKGFRRLVASAGFSDNSAYSKAKAQVELFGDGRLLDSKTVEFGSVVDFDVDLTDVLRLKVQWVFLDRTTCNEHNTLALGSARLLGLAGEVPVSGLPSAPVSTTTTSTSR
ncbi:serine/threonine-protein kinase [Saccharothrix luteola]|uniref:serine/threonine-protein kinase n=1 Tax=Saccharothrix luteola TaxID=2893018 RepID=UPI001E46DD8F|nr:serine/threonine-protein kinase [Saccharothrix luteola]MCC8245498.1 serine/threonine-protein kinase [Saccharothrix luteola]